MQNPNNCNTIRIRNDDGCYYNVESFIKALETEFKIDFRSLPEWQRLIKRLYVPRTDIKRRIQHAKEQKANIIQKLYIESTRPTPFELTDELARTGSKWRLLESKLKTVKPSVIPEDIISAESEIGEELDTPHPNTEMLESETEIVVPNVEVPSNPVISPPPPVSTLPALICTNIHKCVSPLGSSVSGLSCHSVADLLKEAQVDTIQLGPSSTKLICNPKILNVAEDTLKKQSLIFSLTNCTAEYLHVRFKYITDCSPFVETKLLPVIPKRLYPGVAVVYKLIFKLRSQDSFSTGLYFRIGRDVYANAPTEPYFIQMVSQFSTKGAVEVSETVTVPAVYSWHIKRNPDAEYPTGAIKISVNDSYLYHLRIHKRVTDFTSESELCGSMKPSPDTLSLEERDILVESKIFTPSKIINQDQSAPESVTQKTDAEEIFDLVSAIVDDIVQLALDVFVLDNSYVYLQPNSKKSIPVFLTKAEHIGYHQSYYNVEVIDPDNEITIMKKTIKVFGEILPHPVQITPIILDMSNSPILQGYCEDHFTITNNHKIYPVTVHVKLTTKMKKLFCVSPMKCVVPTESCTRFNVRICSREFGMQHSFTDLVHFTIKIILVGYKAVYENVPPIFYEIIAPCSLEFKKVYNEKYFMEIE